MLLRKGGIHEKRFTLEDSRFLLYPTVAHSHAASTRPEHADLLGVYGGVTNQEIADYLKAHDR